MRGRRLFRVAFFTLLSVGLFNCVGALGQGAGANGKAASGEKLDERRKLLDEGENKFHANCGRCHQAPHHLAPRVVMTVERHMRVRATLTDEDVRAIVAYLTQ